MCGFCGFNDKRSKKDKEKIIKSMADRIIHRGPDSDGYYVDNDVALGFRRLSIIDLKGGSQPIYNEDNTIFATTSVPRYRGIENPFGHIVKMIEGINVISTNVNNNVLLKTYICNDLNKFSNTSINDYIYIGNMPKDSGHIKTLIFGKSGYTLPSSVGGTLTYPIGDFYTVISNNDTITGIMVGGSAFPEPNLGLFSMYSCCPISAQSSGRGTRLCYVKNNLKIETL